MKSDEPTYTIPFQNAGDDATGPNVSTDHISAPVCADNAYTRASFDPTKTLLASTERQGEEVTGPLVRYDHSSAPVGVSAYMYLLLQPEYTV